MDFYSLEEASKKMDVSVRTMRHLINEGRVPFSKVVGRIRISKNSLDTFLQSCEVVNAEDALAARRVTERELRLKVGKELRAYCEKTAA